MPEITLTFPERMNLYGIHRTSKGWAARVTLDSSWLSPDNENLAGVGFWSPNEFETPQEAIDKSASLAYNEVQAINDRGYHYIRGGDYAKPSKSADIKSAGELFKLLGL